MYICMYMYIYSYIFTAREAASQMKKEGKLKDSRGMLITTTNPSSTASSCNSSSSSSSSSRITSTDKEDVGPRLSSPACADVNITQQEEKKRKLLEAIETSDVLNAEALVSYYLCCYEIQ